MVKQNMKIFDWISNKTKIQMSTLTMIGGLLAFYHTLFIEKNITTAIMIAIMTIQIISLTEEVKP